MIQDPYGMDSQYWAIIRPGAAHRYISPSMFMVASDDLIHWGEPMPVIAGTSEGHVGAGAPPIKTDYGWLIIYHGRISRNGNPQYEGWAALLDREKPWSSIHRASEPLLTPFNTGEQDVIPHVAFPTGATRRLIRPSPPVKYPITACGATNWPPARSVSMRS
ncbi:MAG: hypothetical protein ACLFT2_06360 [Candidatus Brocadiia bacterium]